MADLELINKLALSKLDFKLGHEIGYGAQGRVFDIVDQPTKVIKFSSLYETLIPIEEDFKRIEKVYSFLIENKLKFAVNIFNFNLLHLDVRETVNGPQKFLVYFSVQEKLCSLTEDEKKVFKTICQLANNELQLKRGVEEVVSELEQWFSFNKEKVLEFYFGTQTLPVDNRDFHRRNILKDKNGNFKIIDFDLANMR